ncbi:recombinase family protein [Blautia sp. HCP3S3_D9]|uniref:recombinase family protein n=1 Tax=unclassified Blautia TaxID=2648079 RepID=UPI0025BE5E1C|nr:recombinase family protein [Blautia sp.]MCI7450426.1 recombinase family protein [Blautia sp.]
MKRVRMLLRVSSNQQLEADGDLSVQRQLVKDYIFSQSDWQLDEKEYFEGSNSGYKNAVADRNILQEALQDAKAKEYDILVVYKDDRIGRRMWEIGAYVMSLKSFGVDIYTVKDGCISPESDDIMGQMMLALRYGNAQKSSSDTGMRVKDTAQKLVQKGKFMGGKAPYGYKLELSGEVSKHGRALHHLVVVPEQAEVVKYIYELSLHKEFGAAKIARILNEHEVYKNRAPRDVWKCGTIVSILTNPIYAGYTAYKRRERIDGRYHKLESRDWVYAEKPDPEITIIDENVWNRTQDTRKQRGDKYIKSPENKDVTIIRRNSGMLALIDVLHCGYCGRKMTNGSRYNYWTIKDTGERRTSKIAIYKCQNAWSGVPHNKTSQYRADQIEPMVFEALAEYIGKLQENENVFTQIEENQNRQKVIKQSELDREQSELKNIQNKIAVMESNIPNAMTGDYPLSLEELADIIRKHRELEKKHKRIVEEKEAELDAMKVSMDDWENIRSRIPTWQDVFWNADTTTKRVLVDKLIERIDITRDNINIRFKINLNDFFTLPRITDYHDVPE